MTNVRGTGWDWPRNKFSLPSGARGRRKHTRLPKIKDQDHFRKESTSTKRRHRKTQQETCAQEKHRHRRVVTRAKNAIQELRGVATLSSQTPTIKNQAQPRKIERPSRRRNMEISRARTPRRRISSNASHVTPPANISMERFVRQALHIRRTKEHELVLATKRCQKFVAQHHKYPPYPPKSYKNKGCRAMVLMKIPGCNKTKGAVRRGDITTIITVVRKRKSKQEGKRCWYQT